jgi:hypothetical protein
MLQNEKQYTRNASVKINLNSILGPKTYTSNTPNAHSIGINTLLEKRRKEKDIRLFISKL